MDDSRFASEVVIYIPGVKFVRTGDQEKWNHRPFIPLATNLGDLSCFRLFMFRPHPGAECKSHSPLYKIRLNPVYTSPPVPPVKVLDRILVGAIDEFTGLKTGRVGVYLNYHDFASPAGWRPPHIPRPASLDDSCGDMYLYRSQYEQMCKEPSFDELAHQASISAEKNRAHLVRVKCLPLFSTSALLMLGVLPGSIE